MLQKNLRINYVRCDTHGLCELFCLFFLCVCFLVLGDACVCVYIQKERELFFVHVADQLNALEINVSF